MISLFDLINSLEGQIEQWDILSKMYEFCDKSAYSQCLDRISKLEAALEQAEKFKTNMEKNNE